MSIKLSTYFVIAGTKRDGTRVYLADDTHSGGFDYWSDYPELASRFDLIDDMPTIGPAHYLRKDADSIEILRVELIATAMHKDDLAAVIKANAQFEIDEINKKLAEKLKGIS